VPASLLTVTRADHLEVVNPDDPDPVSADPIS
jgi:hypothetical protein